MRRAALLSIPLWLSCAPVLFAWAAPPASATSACEQAIATIQSRAKTAPGLLHAIGIVESGRPDPRSGARRPWPWTVTAEGVGTFYASKADAEAAVLALQARFVQSIDVGCMQVNLQQHPAAFATLDDAFEPATNVAYAARFLQSLYRRLGGDWAAAAAAYHSQAPALGAEYGRLIAAVWSGAPVPVLAAGNGAEVVLFPGGGQMRVFRTAAAGGQRRVFGVLN